MKAIKDKKKFGWNKIPKTILVKNLDTVKVNCIESIKDDQPEL